MAKLIINADESYVEKLKKHLEKEHPSTKGRMTIKKDIKKKAFMTNLKNTFVNVGNITGKVIDDAMKPLEKLDNDMKRMNIE